MKPYALYFKRPLSVALSLALIAATLPLMALTALSLAVLLRGNPIFTQQRPGRGGKVFRILKFRTMTDRRDASGRLLPDAERLTPAGRLVRSLSLDELPQLFNVLRGEMALIGPRPLLVAYLPLYDPCQARRHEVRPGITGWAQVNGRNALSWGRKFELDVWYVDNCTFRTDLRILVLTFKNVLKRDGITSEGSVTVEPFTGSD